MDKACFHEPFGFPNLDGQVSGTTGPMELRE